MKKRVVLTFLVLVALVSIAAARPGGGDSFSGGGGSGGGGGIGDAIDIVFFIIELLYYLFELIVYYPAIVLPIIGIILLWIIINAFRQHQNKDWDSGPPVAVHAPVAANKPPADPDFSRVVFEDFAFRLFSTAQRARTTPDQLAAAVGPYVSEAARTSLTKREPVGVPVQQAIVGALRVVRIDIATEGTSHIDVEYEANVATAQHTNYSVEKWVFARAAGVKSKPPGAARTFPCPNCGAPWDSKATGSQTCPSCGQTVDNGRFDWVVEQVELDSMDARPPTLTTEVPERGTDLPTVFQPGDDAELCWSELVRDDTALSREAFNGRVNLIYTGLNQAWSNNELEPVRGLVSDGLFDYLQYWIDAYKRQGLRNQLTNMRITSMEVAKLVRDKYYDAVTVRIWGTGLDFVVHSDTGELVRGSKHRERPYSEYWTFIRSATRKGPAHHDPVCGNCGAPLKITQAGTCDHCGAHVTAGEFDWVLSKIEQDDTYRG